MFTIDDFCELMGMDIDLGSVRRVTGSDVARLANGDHDLHATINAALTACGYQYSMLYDRWDNASARNVPDDVAKPTYQLRWFRPRGGSDNELRLEQRFAGEREWQPVPTWLAD